MPYNHANNPFLEGKKITNGVVQTLLTILVVWVFSKGWDGGLQNALSPSDKRQFTEVVDNTSETAYKMSNIERSIGQLLRYQKIDSMQSSDLYKQIEQISDDFNNHEIRLLEIESEQLRNKRSSKKTQHGPQANDASFSTTVTTKNH
jgi:hypothetical protein